MMRAKLKVKQLNTMNAGFDPWGICAAGFSKNASYRKAFGVCPSLKYAAYRRWVL
jgi:hypothetical protein